MERCTGDGVDPLEGDDGYDDKLERLCPGFARLHEMLKNNPHLHPACEIETTNGQLQIGSRSRQITLGRADEADEADAVFITDDDLEDENEEDEDDDEGLDNRPIANDKTKGKKVEDDEEPNASTSSQGRKYNGQAFQSYRSRSPAASTSSKSTAKRGRSAEQSNSSKKDSGSSSKSGSAKKVTPLGLHSVKPPQKGKSPTDIAEIFDASNKVKMEIFERDLEEKRRQRQEDQMAAVTQRELEERKDIERQEREQVAVEAQREHERRMLAGQIAMQALARGDTIDEVDKLLTRIGFPPTGVVM
ncbi:hypothetical protein BGZ82_004383 [Podila clonocystis]|nr:hypothetical protein BGZ82_004383 [Podila clonocystis]